ncbi:MAG: protein kinase [Chloroflexota bacterium]
MTLERGTLLHKRYRIVEILGQGGMGSVYRAVDENLGVDIALKENLFTTDEYARQFRLEAVILANLRHPNLPRVTDHFVIGDQGQYLVMDYIEGEDLRQRMERVGSISEDEAILIGAAMCDALGYLHTRKPPILHRDIKPGNVKITPDGHIFLVDFGLAKVVQGSQATTTGARAMTPGYSPPEQYGTARTDARTDIYSLGATIYAALTGIIPEDGLARAMDNAQLTPLRKRNAKVSRRLAAAIEKAMAVDPAERFQTAEDFKKNLLGSKSKTQRLAGDYIVSPPPSESEKDAKPKSQPRVEPSKPPTGPIFSSNHDDPEFKPSKSQKRKGGGCLLRLFLLLLIIGAGVGAWFYVPGFSEQVYGLLELVRGTPTSLPTAPPTETPLPSSTETVSPTPTSIPTSTPTPLPTFTPTLPPNQTPLPTETPQGGGYGQFAFASDRTGVPQIYIANLDGSNVHPVTNLPNGACNPSWSPDGSRLVFVSPCSGEFDTFENASLYIVNADGSDLAPLPSEPGGDYDPAWSPDGRKIAFTSLRDGHPQIYVMDMTTYGVTRLVDTGSDLEASQPAWSPFGNQIAYTVKRVGVYQIWVMTDIGNNEDQLVRSGQEFLDFEPAWSMDGQVIVFSQKRASGFSEAWLMRIRYEDRGTSNATRLEFEPVPIENVQFSPDGFWMIFESEDTRDNRDIYIMTIDGANRTRLTSDPGTDFDPAFRPIPGQ